VRENTTVCWICGEGAREGDPWQADHVVPRSLVTDAPTGVQEGTPDANISGLLGAHRSCNIKRAGEIRREGRG